MNLGGFQLSHRQIVCLFSAGNELLNPAGKSKTVTHFRSVAIRSHVNVDPVGGSWVAIPFWILQIKTLMPDRGHHTVRLSGLTGIRRLKTVRLNFINCERLFCWRNQGCKYIGTCFGEKSRPKLRRKPLDMSSRKIAVPLSFEMIWDPGDWKCGVNQAQEQPHACRWRGKRVSVHLTAS